MKKIAKVIAHRFILCAVFIAVAPIDLMIHTFKEIGRAYRNWSWYKHKREFTRFAEIWKEIGK